MAGLYDDMMDALVGFEVAMAGFYKAVAARAPADDGVWARLAREEAGHASILQRLRRRFHHLVVMTDDDMRETIRQVGSNQWRLDTLRWRLDHDDLAGEELVQAAIGLELSVGELRVNQIVAAADHLPELDEYYRLLGGDGGHEQLLLGRGPRDATP
jgi:predicted component of type VI protein secretion system